MDRWTGRVAIVTGASAGIGAHLSRRLVERGMRVVGVARRVDRVQTLSSKLKNEQAKGELFAVHGDITKEEDILRIMDWVRENLGGADVLVNNAGVLHDSPLLSGRTEDWRHQLDVNVLALCVFTREFVKNLRARGVDDGHVIHINSVMGHHILHHRSGCYLYAASKHAVTVLTEGLRRELRDCGSHIRITSVSPGLVKSEISQAGGASAQFAEELYRDNPSLDGDHVADAVEYVLAAPACVNVEEVTLRVTSSTD